jgi:purine-binding chemotaxis protein CheW
MATNERQAVQRSQFLSFVLRGVDYAVPILKVREILQYEQLTPVPGTPASMRGVLNLRGNVVPVVDLATKFGLGETAPARTTCVLVIEAEVRGERLPMGVLADSVREVMEAGEADVEPPPRFGNQVAIEWLLGMARLDRRFVLILDIDRVLSADEGALAEAVEAARRAAEPAQAA